MKKIVCIGGGSLYFTRALPDLLRQTELSGSQIVLYDIDQEKVERMARRCREVAEQAGTGFTVQATIDLQEAVDGADFALASVGGSGADVCRRVYESRYHNADILIPAEYGICQIIGDTCGPAGMMMALRTIPAYLHICREMEKRCPGVVFFNHANPMAVICRALRKYTDINVIGLCHGVQEGIAYVGEILGIAPEQLDCCWIGTNHYYWFTRIVHRGKDVYPQLRRRLAEKPPTPGKTLSRQLSQVYGYQIVYPFDDHVIEFYPFLTQYCGRHENLPEDLLQSAREHGYKQHMSLPGDGVVSDEMRRAFFAEYEALLEKMDLSRKTNNSILEERVGATIAAISAGRREVIIANLANNGAIPNLPLTAEVEVEAVTDSTGVRAIHMGQAPLVLKGMLEKRFVWQELVADAAVKGDRKLALQALLVDEMAIAPDKAEEMLERLLNASRDLLPNFFPAVKRQI